MHFDTKKPINRLGDARLITPGTWGSQPTAKAIVTPGGEKLRPLGPGALLPPSVSTQAKPGVEQLRPLTAAANAPVAASYVSAKPSPSAIEYQATPTGGNTSSLSVGQPEQSIFQSDVSAETPATETKTAVSPGLIMSILALIGSRL